MKNNYEIRGETTAIFVNSRTYGERETLISTSKLSKAKELTGRWYYEWDKAARTFYVRGNYNRVNGKALPPVKLHRWIMDAPDGLLVDHINHDGLNNTDENLRVVTPSVNSQNRRGPQSNSKSGIRGVIWDKTANKWRAFISIEGKQRYIGNFIDKKDAEAAVSAEREKLDGQAV